MTMSRSRTPYLKDVCQSKPLLLNHHVKEGCQRDVPSFSIEKSKNSLGYLLETELLAVEGTYIYDHHISPIPS